MNIKITVLEKQLLHLLYEHPEYLEREEQIYFFSTIAQDFYITLLKLIKDNFTITGENILTNSEGSIDITVLSAILDTEYQEEKYNFYVRELQKNELYSGINEKSSLIQKEVQKEKKDLSLIYECQSDIQKNISRLLEDKTHSYLDIMTLLKNHQEILSDRLTGSYYSSGDFLLDKVLGGRLQGGVAILAANSGMGKSTVAIYYAMLRLVKNLPTFVVNTELSMEGWMDNLLPSLLRDVTYDSLSNMFHDSGIDLEHINEQIEELKKRMVTRNNFLMYPHSFLTLAELEQFIVDCRLHMGIEQKIPLFGIVDLLSMVQEFSAMGNGGSRADNIEMAMNRLNAFCLEHNTFLLATVQLRKKDKSIKIETEEDLLEFKPTLESIKSSSAYEERARWVMGLYAPYRVVRKNQCNPVIKDMVPPITTLTVLKDSYNRQEGLEIQYLMDVDKKMFIPYFEENEE